MAWSTDPAIVGPTNVNPRARRAFDSAAASSNVVSHAETEPTSSRSARYARAFTIAERIFARFRTMPASARSRRSSRAVNRATRSGTKLANARR